MDGAMVLTIVGTVGGFSIPTYFVLMKVHGRLGNHDARLNSIEKKLDKLNGNLNNRS